MTLKTDLIGVWCESASPVTDQHTNALTLSNGGIDGTATGKVGTAGHFLQIDGAALTRASQALLQTGDIDFTLAAWVQLESIGDDANVAVKGLEYILQFRTTSSENRFRFFIANSAVGVAATTFGLPSLATWYYVQAQHDAAGDKIRIRVNNGAWDEQATAGAAPVGAGSNFAVGNAWDGLINQHAFWKALKSDADLNAIYNSGNGLAFSEWDAAVGGNLNTVDLRRQSSHYRH